MAFIFTPDEQLSQKAQLLMLKFRASAVACIQSLHALADLLAHFLYYSLDFPKTDEQKVDASYVLTVMKSKSELKDLADAFAAFTQDKEFPHLNALVNINKHRSIVSADVSQDSTGKYTLQFRAIEYKGTQYPAVDVRDFLYEEYQRMRLQIIKIGQELDKVLTARVAAKKNP